jgi:DNA-directed RNA polymerase specialized sigma24 family protein
MNGVPTANNSEMTREAYEQAYREGRQYTLRFLLSRGVAQDSAEDIAQNAWLRGWERLSQLRNDELVLAWVNTIALNFYRRSIRQERRFQNLQDPLYSSGSMNLAAIDLARILGFCQTRDRLLLEAQIGGSTAKEMAKAQGLSQTAIRIRLFRARRAAREAAEALSTRRLRTGLTSLRAA